MTKDEIKALQKTGIDWLGQPLAADGVAGPKTQWWQGISTLSAKRQEVGKLVLGYHAANVTETTGHNDGPFVDKLFEPVGMQHRGYPWCVALVSYVYTECKVPWPKYHTSAWQVIQWAKENGKLVDEPLPLDLEVFLYPRVKGEDVKGHGRLVLAYDPETKTTAGVDGNVSNTIRVGYRHARPDRYFVRPNGLGTEHGGLTMPKGLVDLDQLGDR